MPDSKLPVLTETSVPSLDDPIYTVDVSDTTDDPTGSSRKLSLTRLLGLFVSACDGRLTTESGVPVSTSNRTAQSTIYFTPYNGNRVSLYDGTRWKLYAFTERSLALSGLTSGLNYDVYLYDDAGTLTLELTAWTGDTTRATALATQDGVYVKSGATTRRYIGTIRTTGTTTTEDSSTNRFVWSHYNRSTRKMSVTEATDSWTYTTAAWRQVNNSSANQVAYVVGVPVLVTASAQALSRNPTSGVNAASGIGIDSSTTNSADVYGATVGITYDEPFDPPAVQVSSKYSGMPSIGYHTVRWLEISEGTDITTWFGDVVPGILATGMMATVEG